MDDSKKSKGKNSSALPVLDPVSEPVSPCVTYTVKASTDGGTQVGSGLEGIWLEYSPEFFLQVTTPAIRKTL
jgi:hypothetical protein